MLDVLFWELNASLLWRPRDKYIAIFFSKKKKKISTVFFPLQFLVIKTMVPDLEPDPESDPYPDPDSLEMQDPDPYPDPDSLNTVWHKTASKLMRKTGNQNNGSSPLGNQ